MMPSLPRFIAAGLALCLSMPTSAAGLQVSPTKVTIAPHQSAQSLWLRNDGKRAIRAQVRVFRWEQENGRETMTPADGVVASPPMLELPAGGQQLVRLVRLANIPTDREHAYRAIVDELPPIVSDENGGAESNSAGLQILLRYSVPVFVAPDKKDPIAPQLQGRLEAGDAATIVFENTGDQHAQIADLSHVDAAGIETILLPGLVGYVLAGHWLRLELPQPLPESIMAGGGLMARINGSTEAQRLAIRSATH